MRGIMELALWLLGDKGSEFLPDVNGPSVCRRDLWNVQPIDPSNNYTGGWPMLEVNHRLKVWDGAEHGRTYSHHATVQHFDNTTIMLWTSAEVDEDSMGQVVMGSISSDGGISWTSPRTIFPEAMLPNQTAQHNFTHWASLGIPQRSWQCDSIARSPDSGTVYAIADSYNFFSDGQRQWDRGAGRIARALDLETGDPVGDPCWLSMNAYTGMLEFENTIYGRTYGMKYCKERKTLNRLLEAPDVVPGWSAPLYNHPYLTSDPRHNVREVTYAVYDNDKHIWQRFWRDEAPTNNSWSVWTECSRDGKDWYPLTLAPEGNPGEGSDETHGIYQSNIPDAKTKQFFGAFSTPVNNKIRYLVSNPRSRATNLTRYPLTLAWQDEHDSDSIWSFKHIGVVQTYPDMNIAPETRDAYKNPGFSYPSAVQVGDNLIIVYSENKQNIWMASVPIASLTQAGKDTAGQST